MSNKKNPYLFYTEYYLISGAYHIANVVHDVLTYTASYSDNIKGYLHNKVVSKQIMLNEMIHNHNLSSNGINNNSNDVDEDGFVVIRMRKPKIKNDSLLHSPDAVTVTCIENKNIECNSMIVKHDDNDDDLQIVRSILNDILDHIDFQNIKYEININ